MSADGEAGRRFGVVTAVRLGLDPGDADRGEIRRAAAVRRSLVEEIRAAADPRPAPAPHTARRRRGR